VCLPPTGSFYRRSPRASVAGVWQGRSAMRSTSSIGPGWETPRARDCRPMLVDKIGQSGMADRPRRLWAGPPLVEPSIL